MKEYYKAYDDRYKTYHTEEGIAWAGDRPSFLLKEIFEKHIKDKQNAEILEIGCGEGQNAIYLMKNGYNISATDVSEQAIVWCKKEAERNNLNTNNFFVLDALDNNLTNKYDLIYTISTLHMLVLDEDRTNFLKFIYEHLKDDGVAIISIMGDGINERNNTDITKSFEKVERNINGKTVQVASTSCRIVNWETFFNELQTANLKVINNFTTTEISGFNSSMIVEVRKQN